MGKMRTEIKKISAPEDKLFIKKRQKMIDFNFGKDTARVFNDMLPRSVPLYDELQRMMGEIAVEFATNNSNIYDLGCSTGITLFTLNDSIDKDVKFIGLDYSLDMLNEFRARLNKIKPKRKFELIHQDLNNPFVIKNASVVILNLTLQFVRPIYRDTVIRTIYEGLNRSSCLILIEKVFGNDAVFNRLFIDFYHDLKKRNGYSKLEIAQKREALENVLIPYRLEENQEMLKRNGFTNIDIFYKWYNFCGLVALK